MKPKSSIHHAPLALLGIPFLLLSSTAKGQDEDRAKETVEVAETKETAEEKGKERLAKEVEKRAKAAAKREVEAAKRAEEVVKRQEEARRRAEEAAQRAKEAAEQKAPAEEPAEEPKQKGEPSPPPGARERTERPPAPMPREDRDEREAGERKERPGPPAEPAETRKPPVEMPVVPSETLRTRDQPTDPESGVQPAPEAIETPATEPERQAETEVTEVTREVQRDIDQRKVRIDGREEAQALIQEILGAESRISRAEIAREERFRPRFERQRPGEQPVPEVTQDQRRAATTYFQERLGGREIEGPPPEFFRRTEQRGDRRDLRVVERVEYLRPRYLNEGRRYVHFDSRAAIPAILMAAQAMNQVRFQPTREIAPMFYERQEVSAPNAMPLPPESYRSADSWVVSYPVDENSMISSEDILFLQGSTQFSDPYSYEVIGVMADAMKAMPDGERFVIEGHASAEGSYDNNMVLSQQRAEHIVREIVRRGVSPYRLLPVGYGESEARHPDDAAEALRGQDRRVVVFRMKPELAAAR